MVKAIEKRRAENELRDIYWEVKNDWFESNGISRKLVFTDTDNIEYTYFDGYKIHVPMDLQSFEAFKRRLKSNY